MLGLSHWPFILILVIVLIIFGPGKLPQIGTAVGQTLREFRSATNELKDEVNRHLEQAPTDQPAPPVQTFNVIDKLPDWMEPAQPEGPTQPPG